MAHKESVSPLLNSTFLFHSESAVGLKSFFSFRTYTVTCVSTSAASLEDTITVYDYIYNASAGPSSLTLTFDTNIVALTTYECSVKLKQENYTSAKSLPSVVTTPALTGKKLNLNRYSPPPRRKIKYTIVDLINALDT